MLLGSKDWEYRARKSLDPILERVQEGEVVIFYESRTTRCLSTLIWEIQKSIDWKTRVVEYEFYLDMEVDLPRLCPFKWPLTWRPQGWTRATAAQLRRRGVRL